MTYKIVWDHRVKREREKQGDRERAKAVARVEKLLAEKDLWPLCRVSTIKGYEPLKEARIGDYRVLFGVRKKQLFIVYFFRKKSKQLSKNKLKAAKNRLMEHIGKKHKGKEKG